MYIRRTEMHSITRADLQYQWHGQIELVNDQPSAFLHQALGDPVPIGDLGIGAPFFAIGFGPWRKRDSDEPDFACQAGCRVHINNVESIGEVLDVFICGHSLCCRPCTLFILSV